MTISQGHMRYISDLLKQISGSPWPYLGLTVLASPSLSLAWRGHMKNSLPLKRQEVKPNVGRNDEKFTYLLVLLNDKTEFIY